jgi:hypothetical protein
MESLATTAESLSWPQERASGIDDFRCRLVFSIQRDHCLVDEPFSVGQQQCQVVSSPFSIPHEYSWPETSPRANYGRDMRRLSPPQGILARDSLDVESFGGWRNRSLARRELAPARGVRLDAFRGNSVGLPMARHVRWLLTDPGSRAKRSFLPSTR